MFFQWHKTSESQPIVTNGQGEIWVLVYWKRSEDPDSIDEAWWDKVLFIMPDNKWYKIDGHYQEELVSPDYWMYIEEPKE